jgi:hypothetical protein
LKVPPGCFLSQASGRKRRPDVFKRRLRDLTDIERIRLIREVFESFLPETESFHGRTGGDLAYLMGAIADRTGHETFQVHSGDDSEFLAFLDLLFPQQHMVWEFIEILPAE